MTQQPNTFAVIPWTQTRDTRAKRGTPATKVGDQLWRIQWTHPFGLVHFCWEYLDRDYCQHVCDKMMRQTLRPGELEANWREPSSEKFYVTARTAD
jgi:hypothetical protein